MIGAPHQSHFWVFLLLAEIISFWCMRKTYADLSRGRLQSILTTYSSDSLEFWMNSGNALMSVNRWFQTGLVSRKPSEYWVYGDNDSAAERNQSDFVGHADWTGFHSIDYGVGSVGWSISESFASLDNWYAQGLIVYHHRCQLRDIVCWLGFSWLGNVWTEILSTTAMIIDLTVFREYRDLHQWPRTLPYDTEGPVPLSDRLLLGRRSFRFTLAIDWCFGVLVFG